MIDFDFHYFLSTFVHYLCEMKTITLEVSDPSAEKMARMTSLEKKAISETLDRLISNRRSLEEIMDDISRQAEKNGLTPEILENILKEIDEERK